MKRRKGGFTLTETLITVAILAIMTAAGATATSVVLSTKNDMVDTANAQILASTALDALADEVRYGRNVSVAGDTITLDSGKFGDGAVIKLVDNEVQVEVTVKKEDTENPGKMKDVVEKFDLLGDATYAGLKITSLQFKKTDDNVKISMTVQGRRTNDLWQDERTVTMLNG